MKVVIITLLILALFLGGAIYFTDYINTNSDKLLKSIADLDQAVLVEDWETAQVELQKIKGAWEEMHSLYEVLLEHYDLDGVNRTLAKIEIYIEVEEKTLTLGEITQLKFVVNLIKERESFTLSNIF